VLFAPAEVFHCRKELFLARGDYALAVKGNQILLAFNPLIEGRADTPDAGAVFGVWARSD
jgi:hypothetical protein